MAEFIPFDPNVEVKGVTILSVLQGIGDKASAVLVKYGLDEIDPDAWYSQTEYLKAYRELADMGFFNMVAVGMKIPDLAEFPPINSVEEALRLLNVAYQMNHRNGEIGEYRYEKISDHQARMICHNPYPSDFDYGLIYRLVQKFAPEGSHVTVVRDENAPSRKKGAESCTYLVSW